MSANDQPMDQFLSAYFGTGSTEAPAATASHEDAEKIAQVELFGKLAAEQGIDISKLSDPQIEWLWDRTFAKEGQAATAATETEEAKLAAAKAEHEAKLASAAKFSEAEQFGKTAAHAYVAELKKIAAAGGIPKLAEFPPKKDDDKKDDGDKKEEKKDDGGDKKPLPPFMQEKKGSFDLAAAELAQKMLVEAKHEEKVATARLNAVLTLGLQESAKTASVQDFNQCLHIRALEFCEAAGYPVNWEQS